MVEVWKEWCYFKLCALFWAASSLHFRTSKMWYGSVSTWHSDHIKIFSSESGHCMWHSWQFRLRFFNVIIWVSVWIILPIDLCYYFIISHKLVAWIICIFVQPLLRIVSARVVIWTAQVREETCELITRRAALCITFGLTIDSNRWRDQLSPRLLQGDRINVFPGLVAPINSIFDCQCLHYVRGTSCWHVILQNDMTYKGHSVMLL